MDKDQNGNMTCRVENGVTYRQSYNAENRISSIARIDGECANMAATILEVWSYAYDGDGTRVSTAHNTGLDPDPDSFTAYYFGGAYEVTDGAVKKYYSFGGQTIMRDSEGLKYFLSDHLGSTAMVLSETGAVLEQQRYLPFGGVRTDLPSPDYRVTSTDFTYTGQRDLPGTGLMDYKARFYSPALGRFIQPDTIIPNTANPQSWNRFSYVTNNPLRYTDPTGHRGCDDDSGTGCTTRQTIKDQIKDLKDDIKRKFKWNMKGNNWSLNQLQMVYQTGLDIEKYVDGLTGGKGQKWMNAYMGGIDIALTSANRGRSIFNIKLPGSFDKAYLAHELAHQWDLNTGHIGFTSVRTPIGLIPIPLGAVDGPGDGLNTYIHGTVVSENACRFCDGTGTKYIPSSYQYRPAGNYGNNSTADYLAESFANAIYYPATIPDSSVTTWIDNTITSQASQLP